MSALPNDWHESTLGSLGRYHNGRAFKKSEWETRGRPIIRIQNLTGSSKDFNYYQGDVEQGYVARTGDLLVSWAATLGAYIWNGPEAVVNQHIFKVDSHIDLKFHKYLLEFKLDELKRQTHGSGMVHITRGKFDAVPVKLPRSLAEQRRIVDMLEDYLSRLDAGDASLETSTRRIRMLREAWLSRQLGDPPANEVRRLSECLIDARGGWSRSQRHLVPANEGVPYLKMNNITRSGSLILDPVAHVAADADAIRRYEIRLGDVLFNSKNSGDLIGKTAVATENIVGWTFNENIMRLRFDERLHPAFVGLWFLSPTMRQHIMRAASASTNVAAVYKHHLVDMPIWIPSPALQRSLMDRFQDLAEGSGHIRSEITAVMKRSAILRRSLLAAAFSGRLTGRSTDIAAVEEMVGV